jgi:hypothetical protein
MMDVEICLSHSIDIHFDITIHTQFELVFEKINDNIECALKIVVRNVLIST